jgi:hypothetical protein
VTSLVFLATTRAADGKATRIWLFYGVSRQLVWDCCLYINQIMYVFSPDYILTFRLTSLFSKTAGPIVEKLDPLHVYARIYSISRWANNQGRTTKHVVCLLRNDGLFSVCSADVVAFLISSFKFLLWMLSNCNMILRFGHKEIISLAIRYGKLAEKERVRSIG